MVALERHHDKGNNKQTYAVSLFTEEQEESVSTRNQIYPRSVAILDVKLYFIEVLYRKEDPLQ